MYKRIVLTIVAIGAIWLLPTSASAHVLITDTSGEIGAVVHINPDDDPVAGEESTIYFDIQSSTYSSHAHSITLAITGPDNETVDVPLSTKGSSSSATYVFPERGAYTLTYEAVSEGHTHTFTHTQRVTRGANGSVTPQPAYAWAEFLMISSGSALVILLLIVINRDKAIAIYSKW